MKIAVVGAGLSGLSVAYLLSQTVSIDIEIILWEEKEGGGGASRTGAGMLHPFAGARSRLNWRGFEGFDATLSYLKKYPEVILQKGILRPPQSVVQRVDFLACAEQFPQEAIFTEAGLWLPHGIVVDLPLYLHHLWKSVLESGVVFEQKKINNREELKDFEVAVFAVGGDFSSFSSLLPDDIQLKAVKGQLLELLWPKEKKPLETVVNGSVYLIPAGDRLLLGATYEKEWIDSDPQSTIATDWLFPKAEAFVPDIRHMPILGCRAGLRGVTRNHRPFVVRAKHPRETWLIGGMGSKGLLYHRLLAQDLVQKMGFPIT